MPGIKGKRLPGRPGRFDPSEPLHMTTRRAAKTGPVNGSPSYNDSTGDDESRRGSLDNLRPVTSYSNESQISAKSRRPSEISVTVTTPPVSHMNGLWSSEQKESSKSKSKPLSPVEQTPSPSRKRKRSSSTPPEQASFEGTNSIFDASFENYDGMQTYEDDVDAGKEADAVDVIMQDDLSDREAPESQASSESGEVVQGNTMMMAPSMDVTPAVSEPVSPVTSESNSQEGSALAKPLGAALEEVAHAAQYERYEQDDVLDVAEDADDADDGDEQARSDDDARPRRGRFGGRRRAKHPIPKVERAMQRQAELKSAYRAIARAQKAVLAEIAQRTIDDLETNPGLHMEALEYEGVKSRLDNAYEERRSHLQAQHELNADQLNQTLEAEQRTLKSRCKRQLEDLQEEQLDRLEYEIICIARAAQLDGIDTNYETEDEDEVIQKPKGMGYRWKRTDALDGIYDSRSRLGLETVLATADLERRFEMRKLLESLDEDDKPKELRGFTVMDPALREMAIEKRHSLRNTNTLAEAAAEIERIDKIPVIPNEQAHGLQLLGDLASRPSIGNSAPPPSRSKGSRDSLVGQTRPRPKPYPLQLQTNYGPGAIPVEMSPRTTQALGDRFDTSMPPPMTPRQGTSATLVRSPEATRTEFPIPSPTMNTPRFNSLQQPLVKQPESRPGSRSTPYSEFNNAFSEHMHQFSERRADNSAAPFRVEERPNDHPLWREYPSDQPPVAARRASINSDRPPFRFPGDLPRRNDRPSDHGQRPEEARQTHDTIKNESSPYHPPYRRPIQWPDHFNQTSAQDARHHDQTSEGGEPRGSLLDMPRSPRSRQSSMTFSVHDFRLDNPYGNSQDRQRLKSIRGGSQPHKTSKAERNGLPRRHWMNKQKRSIDKSGPAGSPTTASSSYAGSPVERVPAPAPWSGPPLHSPLGPPPPTATYQQSSPYTYGPPHYPPSQQGAEYYQHRNSFPPAPPAPASIWNQPSHSNLYAVPHPPPPGVPPEQYNRYAPPPPPGYQHPPPPPSPHPQSAPGSYGQQFGGPPIAPATPGYHAIGFRPAHPPPAFAQQAQQQQQNNNVGNRRRTQSDVSNVPTFRSWNPPSGTRR